MRMPDKTDRFQSIEAIVAQAGGPTTILKLVLVALTLDPLGQLGILGECVRDETVASLGLELEQVLKPHLPPVRLITTETFRLIPFGLLL